MSGISEFLKNRIERYRFAPISYYSGTVSRVGDGVVRVASLPERRYGELLEFENGVFGMALELTEDGVGAVLFDADETVSVGSARDGNRGADAGRGPFAWPRGRSHRQTVGREAFGGEHVLAGRAQCAGHH